MANNSFMSKEEVDLKYSEEVVRGAGAVGEVKTLCVRKEYENTDLRKRIVMKAIKSFNSNSATREIRNLKTLLNEHHIVKMLGYNEFPFFIFMECLNDDLSSYGKKRKFNFSEKDLFKVCMDTLRGLISLQKHQIIHRDIKPRNLLVDFNGSDGRWLLYCLIKICDLGASRPINRVLMEMGKHGELTKDIGTPGFMCPEVTALLGETDSSGLYSFKSDVWSLATSLLYLHTGGKMPFTEPVLKAVKKEILTDERRDKEIVSILESNVRANEIPQLLYLMKSMLKWNENDRISADACLSLAECLEKQELAAATPAKELHEKPQASALKSKANPMNVPIPKKKEPSAPADQHNPSNEDQLSPISLGEKIEDYKRCVHSRKIHKIVMPASTCNKSTMYVARQLENVETHSTRKVKNDNEQRNVKKNIEDFFEPGRPCLVKGEAGLGKSYLSGHLLSEWSDDKALVDSSLCIILMCRGMEQEAKKTLSELIYECSSMSFIQSTQSIEKITYKELAKLAKDNKLTVILEGLDEVRNISIDELSKIKDNVYRAVNENQTLSCIDLIVGILLGKLLQNANLIATGRHIAIDSVRENILDEEDIRPIIVRLMEFNDDNVIEMVHKHTCQDDPECIELPERICQDIIKIFEGNQTAKTMAENPSSCTELIKLFKAMSENKSGDRIVFESSNACTLILEMLLRNLHHSHNQKSTSKHSFTTLKDDTKKDLYELVKLCWDALFNGDYEIKGTLHRENDDAISIVPDTNKQIKISKENIDKMQIFKLTESIYGQVILEPIYLLCLEIISAGYCFIMDKDIVFQKLNALNNIDRIEAILVHIASFVKKDIMQSSLADLPVFARVYGIYEILILGNLTVFWDLMII